MSRTITFNELRRIKNRLPEGSIHTIADKLNLPVQSVRNYFGGSNYEFGTNMEARRIVVPVIPSLRNG